SRPASSASILSAISVSWSATGMSRFVSAVIFCLPLLRGELLFPPVIDRSASVPGAYRLPYRTTGKGELSIRWTDSYGRVIEGRKIPVELNDEQEIGFTLDGSRAVVMKNNLHVHLMLDGLNKKGVADQKD